MTTELLTPLAKLTFLYNAFMKLRSINYKALFLDLFKGFGIALLLSLFIYSEHYSISNTLVNTLSALLGFYLLLTQKARIIVIAGGFIGLLWFYWIGYSFEYYNVGWMAPFITLFFIVLYALFFGILGFTHNPFYRALLLFGLSYVEPMDWNWLQVELPFINSYLGIEKWQFMLILFVLSLVIYLSQNHLYKKYQLLPLLLLLGAVDYNVPKQVEAPIKIKLYSPSLLQEEKWLKRNQRSIIHKNMQVIQHAINEHYDLVVLPESAFPLYLNRNPFLIQKLKNYSHHIDIITGALYSENKQHYNVSYHFSKGKFIIAKKMILVPFGEYIPLPKFLQTWVNNIFFDGTADFLTAEKPTDFIVKGVTFRNAICYEATCEEIYEGNPSYLIAISNNGWFYPSIEPTLQRLLMQFYAKKHNSIIYHSANMGGSGIITATE